MLKRGWDKSPSLLIVFGLSSKTQWLLAIFVRFLSSKYDLMRETKFPLTATFNSLPDC